MLVNILGLNSLDRLAILKIGPSRFFTFSCQEGGGYIRKVTLLCDGVCGVSQAGWSSARAVYLSGTGQ